jgi:hypothetical protein
MSLEFLGCLWLAKVRGAVERRVWSGSLPGWAATRSWGRRESWATGVVVVNGGLLVLPIPVNARDRGAERLRRGPEWGGWVVLIVLA